MRVFRLGIVGVLAGLSARGASAQKAAPPTDTVALVGDSRVTEAELREAIGNQLIALENQEYQARTKFLDALIERRLLENEAAARGLAKDALEKAEIDAKAEAVSDEEIGKVREATRGQLKGVPEGEVTELIRNRLVETHKAERRKAFLLDLRSRAKVRVLLEAPRVSLAEADSPAIGPPNAPVTVVEFSDFQCPYCARAAPVVKEIREHFGDKVRVVFRDFPLPMHKDAAKAAEAGACAREQGKFWEMHDKLFSDQNHLGVAELKESAKALGLDAEAFNSCLDSGRHEATWKENTRDGERYGVSGTPFFFVNGRILSGAVPFEAFKAVIEQELDRVAPPTAPAKASGR
jgi:protein-disulfide isomerase